MKIGLIIVTLIALLAGSYTLWVNRQETPKEEDRKTLEPPPPSIINYKEALTKYPELRLFNREDILSYLKANNHTAVITTLNNYFKEKDSEKRNRILATFISTECPPLKRRCETLTKDCLIESETAFAKSLDQKYSYCVTDFKNCIDRSNFSDDLLNFSSSLEKAKDSFTQVAIFLLVNGKNRSHCPEEGLKKETCEVFSAADCKDEMKSQKLDKGTFMCETEKRKCVNL